ncbi:ectonucleotide pyrophosphatase/phosphodiesterase [Mucilaginibacter sp. RB4R14]|uniref:alkaline phosphatase family protein n=1 Tax=Mucilaginibacter aurantiaciroseus TaxID=2949308 RepID=UPI002091BD9C|nr:ectonucleotide pyrophosphatase/phosphodiesterase [Mucilaginibacter aurantiaciroseus]MCO5934732.1 ectonucleotide pyrophosphatase/phosphodiesterase [Mucilaginibacter aurantiaciroseus]
MKINIYCTLIALVAILGLKQSAKAQAPAAKYVILVTVDGFRPEFYLDSINYAMPTVRELMKNGVAAQGLNPVFPSVTYPNHTTMITGVTPAKHGIYYNTPFEAEGATGKWYWDYSLIKSPTLWDAMHKAGKTTACVRWPVTVNAPIDYRIPEYWNYKNISDAREYTAAGTQPLILWKEVQDNATGLLEANDFNANNDELIQDENAARIAGYIIKKYKPNFTALHLACTDHYEHENGRDHYMVKASVAGADRAIKTLVEAVNRAKIADSTLIIILGDHGFENIYRSFNPNVLLKQAGLIIDVKTGNWKAQFHSSGGSTFLQLKDKNDKATLSKVTAILAQQPDSIKQYYQVINKAGLDKVGADPNVQLALSGLNGTTIGNGTETLTQKFNKVKGTHGFYPDHKQIQTGFVAFGPGLKKGTVIPVMNMVDIAPFICKLTGVTLPATDGTVYPEMFQ